MLIGGRAAAEGRGLAAAAAASEVMFRVSLARVRVTVIPSQADSESAAPGGPARVGRCGVTVTSESHGHESESMIINLIMIIY